jgi:hypothetical protein
MSHQTDFPERVPTSARAEDQPVRLVLHITRKRFEILRRRSQRRNCPIETEASRLLDWALLELVTREQREGVVRERIARLGPDREAGDGGR